MLTLRTTRPLVPSVFGRDFDRLFQGMFSPALMSGGHVAQPAPFPALNLSETEQAYQIEAELPGFAEADIEVQVNDDVLVLTGKRETQSADDTTNYHRRERWSGTFERIRNGGGPPFATPCECLTPVVERSQPRCWR